MGASMDDRSSVMDYPAPLVTVGDDGALDFSRAYGVGVGDWDRFTVAWLYSQYASPAEERAALDALVTDVYASGLRYVADQHSRPVSAGHPVGSLWDNGSDPVAFLEETLAVRRIALDGFGRDRLAEGQSLADLQTVFAPIYLYHRYQALAAAKLIGGINFSYALNGDGAGGVTPVPPVEQRGALSALLRTLTPETLAIDPAIQRLMQPPLDAREPVLGRERIDTQIAPMFDPWQAASAASRLTFSVLFDSARLGRVAVQAAADDAFMGVATVLQQTADTVFAPGASDAAVQLAVQWQYLAALMALDHDNGAGPSVRAESRAALLRAQRLLTAKRSGLAQSASQRAWLAATIERYLADGELPTGAVPAAAEIPPGSPIGSDAASCWHCDSAALLGTPLAR